MTGTFATVDEYIASFPPETGSVLEEIRRAIHRVVPGAGEKISYQIPAVTAGGRVIVYFAGWKHHVSLYPVPDGDEDFERLVAPYRASKGTLKFLLKEPVPYGVIETVTRHLLDQYGAAS
ncbi:DUF1801 domain-containing protein [Oerskovia sp. M15]